MPAPITAYRRLGYVGLAKEASPGTPLAPTLFYKVMRGLASLEQTVTPYSDANTRDTTFELKEGISAKGSFQSFMFANEGTALLAFAMGQDTKTGSGDPYTHTLALTADLPWLSAEFAYADQHLIERLQDVKINALTVDFEAGKPVLITADLIGITTAIQGSATSVSFSDAAGEGPMNFNQGAVTLTGPSDASTLQGQITKGQVKLNHNVESIMAVGSIVPVGLLATTRVVDLTFECVLSGPSLYELTYNGSNSGTAPSATIGTGSLEIKFTSVASSPGPERSIDITLNNVDFIATKPPEINPDAKTAIYQVAARAKGPAGGSLPLVVVGKNGISTAYV